MCAPCARLVRAGGDVEEEIEGSVVQPSSSESGSEWNLPKPCALPNGYVEKYIKGWDLGAMGGLG